MTEFLGIPIREIPGFNATFNALSTLCILSGWWFIRHDRKKQHIVSMCGALFFSTLFLIGYVAYHASVPPVRFEEQGLIRGIYLFILASHILLSFTLIPLVPLTVTFAVRGRLDRHRRVARWTLPIWLYVSFTGVLVYLMLYQWFPPSALTALGGIPTPEGGSL